MFSILSLEDRQKFISFVEAFAHSGETYARSTMSNIEYILRFWAENKKPHLGKMFGDKLILERPIEFFKTEKQLISEIYEALEYGELQEFERIYYSAIEREFGWYTDPYYACRTLINGKNLASNIIKDTTFCSPYTLVFSNGKKVVINEGAKTMRALGKVCKELNIEEAFEQFRLKHSLYLNQKKLKGTLCLSIHPMDYLTMSDNANGWTSCMSWDEDGDFRGGTIEMMNSPFVVVAYLKSNDRVYRWDDQEWNSKLWRSLIIVTPEIIASVKGYPYQNDELTQASLSWLRDLAIENLGWSFPYPCQEIFTESATVTPDKEIHRFEFSSERMYNDFGTVEHWGYISNDAGDYVSINYSGESECIICGSDHTDFYDNNYVICNNCCDNTPERYINCYECGRPVYEDDVYWATDDDIPMCADCFYEKCAECDFSGYFFYKEDLNTVYLARVPDAPSLSDLSIQISDRYLGASDYKHPYWLSIYCSTEPKRDPKTDLLYWNISDWTDSGLNRYWNICDSLDKERYIQGESEN